MVEKSKKWFRLHDSYGVSIDPSQDDSLILAMTLGTDEMAHGGADLALQSFYWFEEK